MNDPTSLDVPFPAPRALDLCAGAGGLSLGLTRAGFDVLGLELDPDAIDTHRRHAGPCIEADLRTWSPSEPFALVAGGVPCQPFSMAGRRLGLDDPRYLVPDFLRIAREARAEAILIENVRGLVRDVRAFRVVLDACEAEYHVAWTVLDAADYGVPQNRDRLFIAGFRDGAARAGFRWPVSTHWPAAKLDGPRERLDGGKKGRRTPGTLGLFDVTYRTVREALGLPGGAFRTGRKEGATGWSGQRLLEVDSPAPCVTARTNPDLLDRPAPVIKANTWHEGRSDRPSQRPGGELCAAIEAAGLADRPATTVQADPRLSIAGHHDRQQNGAVRLTPEQCAALQGFPPGWSFTGTKSSQHRQIGNAVPPALAEAVGRSVLAALRPVTG